MEYALEAECANSSKRERPRLNPCFNGICSRRKDIDAATPGVEIVLILVLMEYALEDEHVEDGTYLKVAS